MKCPKCNFDSSNSEICDSCGVSLTKMRARDMESQVMGDEVDRTAPWQDKSSGKLTKTLLFIIAAAAIGALAWYQIQRGTVRLEQIMEVAVESEAQGQSVQPTDSPVATIVEFSASWCGICTQFTPMLDSVTDDYKGKLRVVKLNYDENEAAVKAGSINGVPSVLIFDKTGKLSERIVGGAPEAAVRSAIQSAL